MDIRWTQPASADFLGIIDWLHPRNPQAALRVGEHILDAVQLLERHPYIGKQGRSPDTRELAITHYPYLVIYEVTENMGKDTHITILRVLHGAMQWPPDID